MPEATLHRASLKHPPLAGHAAGQNAAPWQIVPEWPARWLAFPAEGQFCLYRVVVKVDKPLAARIHLTADERYELYVDGVLHARGPERGDVDNWFYESFDLKLPAGRHIVMARVWSLGSRATSARPGFLLAAEGDAHGLLSTGEAPWDVAIQEGISAVASDDCAERGDVAFAFDCSRLPPDWRDADSGPWQRAVNDEMPALADTSAFVSPDRHYLRPAILRPLIRQWHTAPSLRYAAKDDDLTRPVRDDRNDKKLQFALAPLLQGKSVSIPARTTSRAIVDLGDYCCHYPFLALSGGKGATIRLRHAESLWDKPSEKLLAGRDAINGKLFRGDCDEIRADGREHTINIPRWRAGRFVQLEIQTAQQPLDLLRLAFEETRYDLGVEFALESSIPDAGPIAAVGLRTLQMCAHDTYMTSPSEMTQSIGDARIQALAGYVVSPDARLARKAILMFDASRANPTGMPLDGYPGHGSLVPPAALWWIGMIADYAKWRGDVPSIRQLLPGARYIVERFAAMVDEKGLLVSPRGWNHIDAADGFPNGVPVGGEQGGRSSVLQWQFIHALTQLAAIEGQFGLKAFADQWKTAADNLADAAEKHYWNAKRQLFADDLEHKFYSQHAQILAVLSRQLKADRCRQLMNRTIREKDLIKCSVSFTHHLFEATSLYDKGEYLRSRLPDWRTVIEHGFKTFPEDFATPQHDCHGASSHVLYHILTTIVGIRPSGWGMEAVLLEPHLREGERVKVSAAHPKGMMHLELAMTDEGLVGKGIVPRGVKVSGANRNVVIRQV